MSPRAPWKTEQFFRNRPGHHSIAAELMISGEKYGIGSSGSTQIRETENPVEKSRCAKWDCGHRRLHRSL
jgi:hypothetical protein